MGKTQNQNPGSEAPKDGDEGQEPNAGGNAGEGNEPQVNEHGFPDDTPLAEMTPEQQTAYWKHKARKHENTVKSLPKDFEQIKADAAAFRKSQQTPDQAKEEELRNSIREEVRKDLLKQNAPKLVSAEFKSLVGDKLPAKTLNAFLEDLDHTKFITDDGEVDTERVKTRVEALVPEDAPPANQQRQSRTHQGRRPGATGSGISAGRQLFEELHGTKK
jgi:hypothetical protein